MIPLSEVKEYLGIPASDTSQDAFLTLQEQIVSDAIEAYCRRKFNAANYVETMYADDYAPVKELKLFHYPVNEITSIEFDGVPVEDVRLSSQQGMIARLKGFFTCYGEKLVITYNAGYVEIPPVVKNTLLSIIQERYNKKQSGVDLSFGSDVQRVSIPGTISIDFDYSLQNNEETTLMGQILGNYLNTLTYYRSERAIVGTGKVVYVSN